MGEYLWMWKMLNLFDGKKKSNHEPNTQYPTDSKLRVSFTQRQQEEAHRMKPKKKKNCEKSFGK